MLCSLSMPTPNEHNKLVFFKTPSTHTLDAPPPPQVPAHHALACRLNAYGTPFAAPDLQASAHEPRDDIRLPSQTLIAMHSPNLSTHTLNPPPRHHRCPHTMPWRAASTHMAHPSQLQTYRLLLTSYGMKTLSLLHVWPPHQTLTSSSV
jgi:hypothetical protein